MEVKVKTNEVKVFIQIKKNCRELNLHIWNINQALHFLSPSQALNTISKSVLQRCHEDLSGFLISSDSHFVKTPNSFRSFYLAVCISLSVCLLFLFSSISYTLFFCPSVCLSVCPSVCNFLSLLCVSLCLSVSLCISLCI